MKEHNHTLSRRFDHLQSGIRVLHLCLALAALLLFLASSDVAPMTAVLTLAPIFIILILRDRERHKAMDEASIKPSKPAFFMSNSWKVGLLFSAYVGITSVILYLAGGESFLAPLILWTGLVGFGFGVLSGPNTPHAPLHVALAAAPLAISLAIFGSAIESILSAMMIVLAVFTVFTVQEFGALLTSLKSSRRNEEVLKQAAERKLRKFLETASDWAWQTDEEHRFIYLSPNFEELSGLRREELLGKTRREALFGDHPTVADSAVLEMEKLTEQRAPIQDIEVKFNLPSGEARWRVIKGYPEYTDEGVFVGYWGWAIDVTEKVEIRARLERYNQALERKVALRTRKLEEHAEELRVAKDVAERASRTKTEFIQNISHEFRTPLHVILGYAEMLLVKADDEFCDLDPFEAANEINEAGRGLLRLINNVIAFSIMDDETIEIDTDCVDADDLITAVIADHANNAEKGNVRFLPFKQSKIRLQADYAKLSGALSEIVRNAVGFSPANGKIEVRAFTDDRGIVIEVLDEGDGPSREMQTSAFDPFQIGSVDTRTKTRQGAGMGLAIASRKIKAHGGEIEIGLREQGGARVAIHLPPERLVGAPERSML